MTYEIEDYKTDGEKLFLNEKWDGETTCPICGKEWIEEGTAIPASFRKASKNAVGAIIKIKCEECGADIELIFTAGKGDTGHAFITVITDL